MIFRLSLHLLILAAVVGAVLPAYTTSAETVCQPFTVTSYAATQFPGWTADGSTTTWGAIAAGENIVAVDPRYVPLGSIVWVEGLGVARAADTGGGVLGRHVDWLIPTVPEALEIGRSVRTVCVVPPGEAT